MIGRKAQIKEMNKLLHSPKGEMLAILGRRRVGKTYLISKVYEKHITFDIIGVQHGTLSEQMNNFKDQLKKYFGEEAPTKKPKNWLEAFKTLITLLEQQSKKKSKRVLFFDEVPWLGESARSKFITALGYFWNSWASKQNIIIVICGSATSWILKHIVADKGGLYNRVTKRMHLKPFTLYETKQFLHSKSIFLDNSQIIQLYMALGGIPHYLDQVQNGLSAVQNIQQLCFEDEGGLKDEFQNLYHALFNYADLHIEVVKALHSKWSGMTRQELLHAIDKKDGGTMTKVINELVECDFVLELPSFTEKKNHKVYRLIDEYSIFYLNFIEKMKLYTPNYWEKKSQTNAFKIWAGFAFENICFRHTTQIVNAMQLNVIYTTFSSFYFKGNEALPGTQIDMVLDRADKIINLIEIKYYNEPYFMTKQYALDLKTKISIFRSATNTRKQLFLSMITLHGVAANTYSNGFVMNNITAEDLFTK